jgi:hypothetical protein
MYSFRHSLRGGFGSGMSGMGDTSSVDPNAVFQAVVTALQQQAQPGQPLNLMQIATGAAEQPGGQALIDNVISEAMADPTMSAYIQQRALQLVWDQYKGWIVLGGVGLFLLIYSNMKCKD